MARAMKCPCGHGGCKSWMVDPVAAVQGVGFTQEQAEAVADLLNRGPTWKAAFEYQTENMVEDRVATSTTIHYRATDEREAVASAIRWWRNRHRALPDNFHRCLAVAVHRFEPNAVGEDGYLILPSVGGKLFEWKLETGLGPGVTVGPGLVDDPRMVV